MENIVIRNVKVRDWAKIVRLLKELLHEQPPVALELESMISRTEEWIERFPVEGQGIFVVAEDISKQAIVGFCYLVKPSYRKGEAFIGIAVEKGFRKHDIGSMLFYHIAEWAVSSGIQYIISDIWDWNTLSLNFFKTLGFKQTEHFDDKYHGETKGKIRLIKEI